MKKWTGGLLILGITLILLLSYTSIWKSESSRKHDFFNPGPVGEENSGPRSKANDDEESPDTKTKGPFTAPRPKPQFRYLEGLDDLYIFSRNMTKQDSNAALLAWSRMKLLFPRSDALPDTAQGIKEAVVMWKDLLLTMFEKDDASEPRNAVTKKACPHFLTPHETTLFRNESFLEIPCGLVEDSSVTVIGIPDSREDSFQIELIGSQFKELKPPIVLHYNVILPGENLTKEPVTVQNTWTQESGWGEEEKCPDRRAPDLLKVPERIVSVDGLVKCNTQTIRRTEEDGNIKLTNASGGSTHESTTFNFVEGNPFTATMWAGNEGFHMTLNGRHETSFVYRERLEPWMVNRVNVKGGLSIVSILAKGLPVDEDVDLVADAQQLKATSFSNIRVLLFIGVFSSGNNFERRMAIRRTWMQYDAVRSGDVAVRFFIGLHKNRDVNFKLWKEAQAYGDIQLMPFVDYYSLLTYKTIAICIFGTKILRTKYIMKIDDDAFVRIDEVLSSLKGKASEGLLYGHISFESAPHRDKDNKWFISDEEWPHSSYPPWAHGPGYVISRDIARFIVQAHQDKDLMLFKLEDVAVGIWIEQYGKNGHKIEYANDDRFHNAGCESDYVLAHYQNPRMMLCLWEKLQKEHKPECCD